MNDQQPLNVTVFGASVKIGAHVVDQLLTAGHHVTAYVRNPTKLATPANPNLTVVQGELADATRIREAVTGADAVISALGPTLRRGAKGTPVADGTRNIVDAMETAGVKRFVGLATPVISDPKDGPTLKGKILRLMPRLTMPNALVELDAMTDTVRSSDLDWAIARITNPTDKPAKHTTRAGFLGHDKIGMAMTRADIATFLIGQLTDGTYHHAAPAISN
jgi:putative NADH-flavin reductase